MKSIKKKETVTVWYSLLAFLCLFLSVGCNNDNSDLGEIPADWISELPATIDFDVTGGVKEINLKWNKNVNPAHVACILAEENRRWCDVKLENSVLSISVSPSAFGRSAAVTLALDKDHKSVLYVNQKSDFSAYFTDETCSELKDPHISDTEIEKIPHKIMRELARELKAGTYSTEFRVADFRPYQHPSVMAAINKTGKYGLRDNVTGIYAAEGDEMYVYVGKIYEDAQISLLIQDLNGGYNNFKTLEIHEGLNRIIAPIGGLIYILNHVEDNLPLIPQTDEEKKAIADKSVSVHFIFGRVNGYFDKNKHQTQEKWEEILANATYQDIDVLGDYSHITWNVEQFKGNNVQSNSGIVTDIMKTIDNCDRLVYLEEEFMGLVKYNKMFNNRMHFCLDYKAESPNATDYRTVYSAGAYYAEIFCNPERFPQRLWAAGHEVGHVNQTRPGLKWAGLTEVTNNIKCLYLQEAFGEPIKLNVKPTNDANAEAGKPTYKKGDYATVYEMALDYYVKAKRAHCLPNIDINYRELQLVPFWQLKLYLVDALEQEDFYHDLYEYFRNNNSPSQERQNSGLDQLDFVRQVCRISKMNLLDYFKKMGFLTPVNTTLNDYGNKIFIITQNQINALIEEIEAATEKGEYTMAPNNIEYITDSNWQEYKK